MSFNMKKKNLYSESIYKEYRKLEVGKVDTGYTSHCKDYNYDTNYNLFDLKKKKIVLHAMRQACFSKITGVNERYRKGYRKSNENYRLDIFIPSCECQLPKEDLMRFIRLLRVIGKFKFKTLKNYRLNRSYNGDRALNLRKAQDVYLIQLKYSDYKCMEHIKLLTHTLRYCYEYNNYKLIEHFLKFKDNIENKWAKIPFLSTFYTLSGQISASGHSYSVSLSTLKDKTFIEKFLGNNKNYHNSSFSFLETNLSLNYSYIERNTWNNSDFLKSLKISSLISKKLIQHRSYKEYLKDIRLAIKKGKKELEGKKDLILNNYE